MNEHDRDAIIALFDEVITGYTEADNALCAQVCTGAEWREAVAERTTEIADWRARLLSLIDRQRA